MIIAEALELAMQMGRDCRQRGASLNALPASAAHLLARFEYAKSASIPANIAAVCS